LVCAGKKNGLERNKNEETDEKNAVGGVNTGNRFWVGNNDCGLQEERGLRGTTERDPTRGRNNRRIKTTPKQDSVRPERLSG
jgi:hypothetical protein